MKKIGLFEKIYNWAETFIMRLVPRNDVGPVFTVHDECFKASPAHGSNLEPLV